MELENSMNSADYSASLNRFVLAEVPSNSECLDVGCWTGNLGKLLNQEKNCLVDGLDFKVDVLASAAGNGYRETFLVNLNDENFDLTVVNKKYQVIICADTLEHLIDPLRVLAGLKNCLAPNGRVIISLPNVAFLFNRLQLLFGNWNYRDYGTLDKTHLRFYTIKSGVKMVEAAGFKIEKLKPYNQFGILRYLKPLERIFPSLLAYQFLIVAGVKPD